MLYRFTITKRGKGSIRALKHNVDPKSGARERGTSARAHHVASQPERADREPVECFLHGFLQQFHGRTCGS